MNEADTCCNEVVPHLQATGWDDEPHSIAEQRMITDRRIVQIGRGFVRSSRPPLSRIAPCGGAVSRRAGAFIGNNGALIRLVEARAHRPRSRGSGFPEPADWYPADGLGHPEEADYIGEVSQQLSGDAA